MAVSRADVFWAYRTLLGRSPENQAVVDRWIAGKTDRQQLILGFASTQEFLTRGWSSKDVQKLVQEFALGLPPESAGSKAYERLKPPALLLAIACAIVYLATTLLPFVLNGCLI